MAVSWDNTHLPLSRLSGGNWEYVDNSITTQFDSGRIVTVRRNTAEKRRYSVTYPATRSQRNYFFTWYERTLKGGTFLAKSLRAGESGTREYRLEGVPSVSRGSGITDITMQWIEV